MLTDFVPCLRLFDILFPEAEDPDRAMELQTVNCPESCSKLNDAKKSIVTEASAETQPADDCDVPMDSAEQVDAEEVDDLTDTSADESNDDDTPDILPPPRHQTLSCHRNHARQMHLTTAPVCLWQHVLRKSRTGQDHLPRVMPPALRPMETRISYRLKQLLEAASSPNSTGAANSSSIPPVSWKQLIIILNAYSTDNEANQLIQHLVDMFWCSDGTSTDDDASYISNSLWSKLQFKGSVSLPYGLTAYGRLQPLSNHLVRTMSVHLRMLILHMFLQKLSSTPYLIQPLTPAVLETICRILACREVEPSNVGRILGLLPKLKPSWSAPTSTDEDGRAASTPSSSTNSPTGSATCHLLSMLLDVLGYRLVDTFIPEVRTQTAVTLVALLRLWTLWLPSEDAQVVAKDGHQRLSEIPLELFYMLEWTIIKSVRSLHAPDVVIYGLCPLISPSSHNQVSNMGGLFNPLFANTATSGANRGIPLSGRQPLAGFPSEPSASSETTATTANAAASSASNPTSPYLVFMSECVELNRFNVIALLQIYYAFDLEEVSNAKSFLVEQFRTLFERSGSTSLSDLPPLVRNRLPDFLVNLLRQRSSPTAPPGSSYKLEGADVKMNMLQIPLVVTQEFEQLSNSATTWMELANTSTVYFCLVFRYLATHRSVPKTAIDCALCLPLSTINTYLRTFCDFVVNTLASLQSESCAASKDFLSVLRSFFLEWRVVPLDRFLMFLLTQTNYQPLHVTALNCLLVHIFVYWTQLTEAISCMISRFPTVPHKSTSPTSTSPLHPDPISSRRWPECVLRLHEIVKDTGIMTLSESETDIPPNEARLHLKLPVLYGHLMLRLLPMLETIFAHLLQTEVPLVQLIPLCRAITPLFRFHRRPINVCYVLLKNHWHFVPMEPEGYWNRDTQTTNDAFRRWLIDHIRVQLIVHCVLNHHHALALNAAAQKKRSSDQSLAGLFTPGAWSDMHSTYKICVQMYEKVMETQPDADWMGQVSCEVELQSMVCNWYRSREKWLNTNYVFTLLEPVRKSTLHHGLSGHPTAWRPWNLEESVSVQAAGLYSAAVEIMSAFATPLEIVNVWTEFLFSRSDAMVASEYLNIIGSLTSILPIPYRLSLCRFASTLINDPLLIDPTPDGTWAPPCTGPIASHCQWGPDVKRPERHAKFLYHGISNSSNVASNPTVLYPPRVAVHFFDDLMNTDSSSTPWDLNDPDPQVLTRRILRFKISLWHAIWSHANTTQLNALPSLFAELVVPHIRTEAQLLMSFHLVAPLMGALHTERPAKLIDLTAELYRALRQVDSCLATHCITTHQQPDGTATDDGSMSDLYPNNTGTPLVHVDTIADLLYHIKYMYVGNGVLDQVRPILPRLRPTLRKRLKFILPPSESLQVEQMKPAVQEPGVAIYEGRIYKACLRPPVGYEDF